MSKPLDDTIPPAHAHRTLVLCFDGTGNQFHDDNSNVLQLFDMLQKDVPSQQIVYYQARIGTSTIPQLTTLFLEKWKNFDAHVLGLPPNLHPSNISTGGYEFLMQNYEAGDRVCLFGFSTGAYTARALAGMLHKVGLLPRCHRQHVLSVYKMYVKSDEVGWRQSTAFKKAFSLDVDIDFVGVWDTVNSVGIGSRRLPFTPSNRRIRFFRQALALDEHRVYVLDQKQLHTADILNDGHLQGKNSPNERRHEARASLQDMERRYSQSIPQTDFDEVWFAGCHCDVGGGSVMSGTRNSLARIPLRWMIREIFKASVGILFHGSMFQQIGMDPSTLYPHVVPRPPAVLNDPMYVHHGPDVKFVSEEIEDLNDALSPIYDQLKIAPSWWLLELLPLLRRYPRESDGAWVKGISLHLGRARNIPVRRTLRIHRTVKTRMEALPEGKYYPKARLRSEPQWVD
ncbi:hypothetical protein EDC04DRAFT_2573941 [Pisolithus marmoratus]|nr:hypothetical protein EDC04DRAFT_2573941 [Pisolithus marmoratus]